MFVLYNWNYFNPRSHEGSDPVPGILPGRVHISTHAPTRGATLSKVMQTTELLFQPTLPRGERRHCLLINCWNDSISTHAPTRGATRDSRCFHFFRCISTHAPTRGATKLTIVVAVFNEDFNPRSHEGSDTAHMQ